MAITLSVTTCVKIEAMNTADYEQPRYREAYLMEWHTRPCQVLHTLRPHSTGTHGHARYYILSGPTTLAHTAMPGTTYSQAPLHWHTRPCQVLHTLRPHSIGTHGRTASKNLTWEDLIHEWPAYGWQYSTIHVFEHPSVTWTEWRVHGTTCTLYGLIPTHCHEQTANLPQIT